MPQMIAHPVPQSDASSIVHPPFSWEIQRKIIFATKKCPSIIHPRPAKRRPFNYTGAKLFGGFKSRMGANGLGERDWGSPPPLCNPLGCQKMRTSPPGKAQKKGQTWYRKKASKCGQKHKRESHFLQPFFLWQGVEVGGGSQSGAGAMRLTVRD